MKPVQVQMFKGTRQRVGLRDLLEKLNARITVDETFVAIAIDRCKLAKALNVALPVGGHEDAIQLDIPVLLKRRGQELRLVYGDVKDRTINRDEPLIRLVAKGWRAWNRLASAELITDKAERSELTRFARLRFLAPDIITAILEGRQPVELTARKLLRTHDMPIAWEAQRRVLGFI